jgi:4-hydroxyproline epimerase
MMLLKYLRIPVVDSHTGGEPTRVVLGELPDLGEGSIAEQAVRFRTEFDNYRACIVQEPRGSDVLVGALLLPPADPSAAAGVIFFNNVSTLGMCGHGLIGVITTMQHCKMIEPGDHIIETPVGLVTATLYHDGRVSVRNVESYRVAKNVPVEVPGLGQVVGDIAWGGNWFFLTESAPRPLQLEHVNALTEYTHRIKQALPTNLTSAEIDHVEVFAAPINRQNHSRNFVLCPGNAFDRSPCGTGTSAKLACLAADGKLAPGEIWRQESITGSVFEASYEQFEANKIIPTITGQAFITSDCTLLVDPDDPFRFGFGTRATTS